VRSVLPYLNRGKGIGRGHSIEKWVVRHCLFRFVASTGSDQEATVVDMRCDLLCEPRLSCPRFACQQNHLAMPFRGPIGILEDLLQLALPCDERSPRQRAEEAADR
jgi:hypothetical protein